MSQRFAFALGKRFALVGAVGALLAMPACSSSPGASTNGTGGQTGQVDAGADGADARADAPRSGAGGYTPPPVVPCTPAFAMKPLLTDFSTGDTFGDGVSMPTGIAEAYGGLTTDTSGGNWHVSGTVMGDSGSTGFFIDFSGCPVDLSRHQGLEFTIGGVVSPNGRILLQVFTAEDNYVQLANMPPTSDDVVLHNSCSWTTNMYRECVEPLEDHHRSSLRHHERANQVVVHLESVRRRHSAPESQSSADHPHPVPAGRATHNRWELRHRRGRRRSRARFRSRPTPAPTRRLTPPSTAARGPTPVWLTPAQTMTAGRPRRRTPATSDQGASHGQQ